MGSSVVLRRRIALSAWRNCIRRAAGPLVFPPCWLQAHIQMGFWEASCRGTGAADGTFDSSTPARRGLIRGDSGRGLLCGCRALGTGQRMTRLLAVPLHCPASLQPPGTLSRARSGTGTGTGTGSSSSPAQACPAAPSRPALSQQA
jgi:hypothetical protein